MIPFRPSRRQMLCASVIGGITVYLAPLGSGAFASLFEQQLLTRPDWNSRDGALKYRIDGTSKVTGDKVFARDIRARDMPHWPQQQSHALMLRATSADRGYAGFDLAVLGTELAPDRVVAAADLARDGLAFPDFYGEDMLLPEGKTPAYLGQAVAILIYHDFARLRFAKQKLQFNDAVVRYGAVTGPLRRDPWGASRFVRVGGKTPYDEDAFSCFKQGPVSPSFEQHQPVWPDPARDGDVEAQGMYYAKSIDGELMHPPADWLVLTRDYATQSGDTAALEPDNANGWYDADKAELHLVVPTQSPQEVARCGDDAASEPHRPEAVVPASVLHGRIRLEGSLHHAVLWPRRRGLRRRPTGAARQRSIRSVPVRLEAAPVQHALHGRGRAPDRSAAIIPSRDCRQWRRTRELLRRPHHGGRDLGGVGLLFPEVRRGRDCDRLARAAALANYLRATWGGQKADVTPAAVRALR
jgi:hypothetical protein